MFVHFLMITGVSGFLAVAFGAFAAHGLESRLSADMLATFQTGVNYHMYHTLALLAVALLSTQFADAGLVRLSGWLFIIGILLFSGSLYVLSLSGVTWLGAITPLGGLAFLGGWGCLFLFGLNLLRQ